mmetsp:Transcript_9372/g.12268  ORF Transcript_9372/g.12268 Transcript_9372/m.12268 type:complete len:109 (+) Transcript_9372:780-1106(+)
MSKSSKVAKLYQLLEDINVTGDDEPSKKSPYLECSFCNAPAHIFLDCNDLYQAMTRRRNQRENHWESPPKQNAAVSIDEEKSESETEETCNAVTDGISSSISQPMTLW